MTWYSEDMHRVAISAPLPQKPANLRLMGRRRGRGVGSMFSGGVDSFHTLAKNRDGIDALIYGFGIDVPVRKSGAVERVHAILEDVAADSGKRLLVADTNIRKFLKNDTLWSREAHGAALTSLATVFSTVIDRVLDPRHTYVRGEPARGDRIPCWTSTGRHIAWPSCTTAPRPTACRRPTRSGTTSSHSVTCGSATNS